MERHWIARCREADVPALPPGVAQAPCPYGRPDAPVLAVREAGCQTPGQLLQGVPGGAGD